MSQNNFDHNLQIPSFQDLEHHHPPMRTPSAKTNYSANQPLVDSDHRPPPHSVNRPTRRSSPPHSLRTQISSKIPTQHLVHRKLPPLASARVCSANNSRPPVPVYSITPQLSASKLNRRVSASERHKRSRRSSANSRNRRKPLTFSSRSRVICLAAAAPRLATSNLAPW